jgi:hypothetical protein
MPDEDPPTLRPPPPLVVEMGATMKSMGAANEVEERAWPLPRRGAAAAAPPPMLVRSGEAAMGMRGSLV